MLNDSQRAEYRRLRHERSQRGGRQGGEGRGQRVGHDQGRFDGTR